MSVPADGRSRVMHLAYDDIAVLPVGPRGQQRRRVHVRRVAEVEDGNWLVEGTDDHGRPFREHLPGPTEITFVGRWYPGVFS